MARIIYKESDIVRGKLYKSLYSTFADAVLYLGCHSAQDNEKFLVIVVDDYMNGGDIGRKVFSSKTNKTLWNEGFEELDA